MCGICGMVGFANQDLLKKMCRIMSHRGPDDEGYFIDKNIGLGIRRLSIIDLETGHQPIHNEDETIWVVFNGEIYNFQELRESLKKKGHQFYTKTDTEVIIHLYEEKGEDCVNYLNGMFAFAIWDKKDEKLFLARDRLGIKPLYYTVVDGSLLFASEIKALLECNKVEKEVDLIGMHHFLTFLYVPAPFSMFKGIKKLPPAHTMSYKNGKVGVQNFEPLQYWDLGFSKAKIKREEYYSERILELLREAVKIRLVSDVPLGIFLSGGIDSSSIVGLMSQISNCSVKTFSIGYEEKFASYNELKYSRLVAKHFGTEHHEFIVKPDAVELLPEIIQHFDEPFADSSAIPTYLVSQMAKKHITVALSGIGGDEAFGGYPRYIGLQVARYYEKLPLFVRKNILLKIAEQFPESTASVNIMGRFKRFARGGILPADKRYLSWISFFNTDFYNKLFTDKLKKELSMSDPFQIHREFLNQKKTAEFLNRVFYLDVKTYLADDLLAMGDRMSMANSLELRIPFCDHKLLEFSASIPYSTKIEGFRLKYLLKRAVSQLLPKEIITKRKQGFMIPLGSWLQTELKDLTLDLLSKRSVKKRNYFNWECVQWMLREHYEGRQNFADQIWALMTLEIWHRIYIDNKPI